jgi:hypothetical protein
MTPDAASSDQVQPGAAAAQRVNRHDVYESTSIGLGRQSGAAPSR